MPKFAANLTMLWNELEFLARFEAARAAGFHGVEYLFPYPFQKQRLAEELSKHQLVQVLHNLPAGDWTAGERGIACHPARVAEFQDGVGTAIEYASALGCKQLNCLAGIAPRDASPEAALCTFVDNLKFAAGKLAAADIQLLIEPINTRDIPGFFLCGTEQALAIMNEVAAPNLRLLYDIYHMQIMQGDLARTIERHLSRIGHLQLADNPGRHEPGTGEINYPFLFQFLDGLGYQGFIGCEYKPSSTTQAGLGWLKPYL